MPISTYLRLNKIHCDFNIIAAKNLCEFQVGFFSRQLFSIFTLFSWYTLFHSSANLLNYIRLQNSIHFGVIVSLITVTMLLVSFVDMVCSKNQPEERVILLVLSPQAILLIRTTQLNCVFYCRMVHWRRRYPTDYLQQNKINVRENIWEEKSNI
jgi:hypothetical protein